MLALSVFFTSFFQTQEQTAPVSSAQATTAPAADSVSERTLQINRIIILGNKITRGRIILRELSFKPGDTVSSVNIDNRLVRDRAKVYNLRLFNTVVVRWMDFDPATGLIDII